jgi:hypothetical protein
MMRRYAMKIVEKRIIPRNTGRAALGTNVRVAQPSAIAKPNEPIMHASKIFASIGGGGTAWINLATKFVLNPSHTIVAKATGPYDPH